MPANGSVGAAADGAAGRLEADGGPSQGGLGLLVVSARSSASARSWAARARSTSIWLDTSATSERTVTRSLLTSMKPPCTAMTSSVPSSARTVDRADVERADEGGVPGEERDVAAADGAREHHLRLPRPEDALRRDDFDVQGHAST